MNGDATENSTHPESEQPSIGSASKTPTQQSSTGGPYYYPPAPPGPKRNWLIPLSLAIGCLPWLLLFVLVLGALISLAVSGGYGEHLALIRVSGTITSGRSGGGIFGDAVTGSEDVVYLLEKARKDRNARAVIIRINSAGGSAAGSQEIYDEIIRVRKSGKPVYCSMGSVAASGGYYIASACDKIYAGASTVTGSIGVIFETADLSELFKKIGLNPQVIKSGKYKDIGSPNRAMTPEERKLLTGMLMEIYEQFVKAVSDGRRMPIAEVRKIADGRVLTGRQALRARLVDEIGGLQEATMALAKAVGIKDEPQVIEYGRKSFIESILGAESGSSSVDAIMEKLLRSKYGIYVK